MLTSHILCTTIIVSYCLLWSTTFPLKNIHNYLRKLGFKVGENNVVSFYFSDSVLPIRMAPKIVQKHVDLPVFSEQMKGWTQWQLWYHTIPYCFLTDYDRILYTRDLSTVSRMSIHFYLIRNILLHSNRMSLYTHQILLLPRYLMLTDVS